MKYLMLALLLGLASCNISPEEKAQVAKQNLDIGTESATAIADVDGCRLYRVWDELERHTVYFAKCGDKAVGASEEHDEGRHHRNVETTTVGE